MTISFKPQRNRDDELDTIGQCITHLESCILPDIKAIRKQLRTLRFIDVESISYIGDGNNLSSYLGIFLGDIRSLFYEALDETSL